MSQLPCTVKVADKIEGHTHAQEEMTHAQGSEVNHSQAPGNLTLIVMWQGKGVILVF